VAAFCRRAGVSQPSFYAWRRKLRGETTFAEVKLSAEPVAETGGIELRLPGRRCVVVRPGFDRQTLVELLHVLEASSVDLGIRQADATAVARRRAGA
jgi:transposase-like protein